jgi:hypothetical protein
MICKVVLLCVPLLLMACDQAPDRRFPLPTQATPTPNAPDPGPPPAPIIRRITVGEEVKGHFAGLGQLFEFTAPADGRLVARLTWNVGHNGTLLTLQLGETEYKPVPPQWSPLVGTWTVAAGRTYQLSIGPGGSDWFYDDAFTLIIAME